MNEFDDVISWAELQGKVKGSLGGWMTADERERLFHVARALRPCQRLLEIGVYGGTTLSIFALMAPDGAEIIGMDDWSNATPNNSVITGQPTDLRSFCVENLELNAVRDRVRLIDGSSHELGPKWDLPLDVLVIDGGHTEEDAYRDLCDFARWVKVGGVLFMDDYYNQIKIATDRWLGEQRETSWLIEHVYADQAIGKMLTLRRSR